jgi:hypothetical protein
VTPCRQVDVCWHFRIRCCLHLQGRLNQLAYLTVILNVLVYFLRTLWYNSVRACIFQLLFGVSKTKSCEVEHFVLQVLCISHYVSSVRLSQFPLSNQSAFLYRTCALTPLKYYLGIPARLKRRFNVWTGYFSKLSDFLHFFPPLFPPQWAHCYRFALTSFSLHGRLCITL